MDLTMMSLEMRLQVGRLFPRHSLTAVITHAAINPLLGALMLNLARFKLGMHSGGVDLGLLGPGITHNYVLNTLKISTILLKIFTKY